MVFEAVRSRLTLITPARGGAMSNERERHSPTKRPGLKHLLQSARLTYVKPIKSFCTAKTLAKRAHNLSDTERTFDRACPIITSIIFALASKQRYHRLYCRYI